MWQARARYFPGQPRNGSAHVVLWKGVIDVEMIFPVRVVWVLLVYMVVLDVGAGAFRAGPWEAWAGQNTGRYDDVPSVLGTWDKLALRIRSSFYISRGTNKTMSGSRACVKRRLTISRGDGGVRTALVICRASEATRSG